MLKRILVFTALFYLLLGSVKAENALWKNISDMSSRQTDESVSVTSFQLDASWFQQQIAQKQRSSSPQKLLIDLPLPSGDIVAFQAKSYSFEESPSDDFHAWKVASVSRPSITGVIDYSTVGFHATLFMPDGEIVVVDPQDRLGESQRYGVKLRSASHKDKDFSCALHDHPESFESQLRQHVPQRAARGLKTYRLAMAATRQYTNFLGSQNNALNAIRATVNRVNAIYERDLELQLILVSGTNLVFTNTTNPYIEGVSSNPLMDQNTGVINSVIGSGAYDIGHLVSQGGSGGIASLASVCSAIRKGAGFTSRVEPQGDAFDIDFVSHEIGHQLGATHTFNSATGSCAGRNRVSQTAYEPGSGTSIMAYAGICGLNNLQLNSDAMFHIASIEQIDDTVSSGSGASCGNFVGTTNSAPDIDLSSVTNNITVNAGEAFTLTGTATDIDAGQTLSYNWDQFDAGTATDAFVDAGDNALYRSTLPSASPSRTFPGYTTKNRTLLFKFVVRDGNGGVSSTPVTVNVVGGESSSTPTSSASAPQLPLDLGSGGNSNSSGGGAMLKLLMLFSILWGIGLMRKTK